MIFRDPTPNYQRVALAVKTRIDTGEYQADQQIPTENELMEEFRVSRHTVRAAISELAAQGLLRRQAGRGTFVQKIDNTRSLWAARSMEDLLDRNFGDTIVMAHARPLEPGSSEEALARHRLSSREPVTRFTWLRHLDGEPVSMAEVDLPRSHAAKIPPDWAEKIKDRRLLRLVEETSDLLAVRVHQTVMAIAAPAEIARLLDVAPGTPLLSLERIYTAEDGSVIESSRILVRSDKAVHVVELEHRAPTDGKGRG